jgi:hypothetical protein
MRRHEFVYGNMNNDKDERPEESSSPTKSNRNTDVALVDEPSMVCGFGLS